MTADLDVPLAKKRCPGHVHHHKPRWNPVSNGEMFSPCQDEAVVQSLLTRAISLALEAVGFGAADPVAIESFSAEVEECNSESIKSRARRMMLTLLDMAHFLTDVRRSMLSSRRTRAIPQDFLQALHTHQLSLKSLIPHLDPPVSPSRSQFALPVETAEDEKEHTLPFLGPVLNGAPDERSKLYVPRHFPAFPSKHTYKATPEFPIREKDPRRIRELATEEGRMGEEALRRLVGSGSDDGPEVNIKSGLKVRGMRRRRDEYWRETMQILNVRDNAMNDRDRDKQGGGHPEEPSKVASPISSAVNADKRFWRKGGVAREPQPTQIGEAM